MIEARERVRSGWRSRTSGRSSRPSTRRRCARRSIPRWSRSARRPRRGPRAGTGPPDRSPARRTSVVCGEDRRPANVAVVEADHEEAALASARRARRPEDHLGAEAHDQQHRRIRGIAERLVGDLISPRSAICSPLIRPEGRDRVAACREPVLGEFRPDGGERPRAPAPPRLRFVHRDARALLDVYQDGRTPVPRGS